MLRFETILLPLLFGLAGVTVRPAHADVVLYSTGFEGPTFTPGVIAGQDGWATFGPGISTVENSFAKTGSQAVFIDGGTATQSGPYHADATTGPLVDLSADIAIFTSSTQTGWQFAGLGPGLTGFLGGIDIDNNGANSTIHAITAGFPIIGTFARATGFDATAWHHIDLLFDIATQTYDITLDGVTLATNEAFCGDNGPCAGAHLSTYADGFFDSFGGVSGSNDSAYMDNYRVALESPVPEPSTIFLLMTAFGGVGLAMVRRKLSWSR